MSVNQKSAATLQGVRVLDASEYIAGPYAARLLHNLGAEVIKLESPAGDGLRAHGPFPPGDPSPDNSALFHILNGGKRGIVLDPAASETTAALDTLLASADVVLSSSGSAFEALIGARRKAIAKRHPRLTVAYTAGTAAEHGLASRSDSSIHAAALSGISSVIGDPERVPLVPPYDLLDYLTGANIASGIVLALFARERLGRGQVVEMTTRDIAAHYLMVPRIDSLMNRAANFNRSGRRSPGAVNGIYPWGLYPCSDGLIAMVAHAKHHWMALLECLGNPEWRHDPRLQDPMVIAQHHTDEVDELMKPAMKEMTRWELFTRGNAKKLALGPVLNAREVVNLKHLKDRGSLGTVEIKGARIPFVKRPFILSDTPMPTATEAPPRLGSAARTVDASIWKSPALPVSASPPLPAGAGPLSGLRIVDFSWNWAGPMVSAALSDLGAEVIKVEHKGRMDNARIRARPKRNGKEVEGPLEEVSCYFHANNRGKYGATFDIKHPQGLELVTQLIASADMVVENFTPGVFERAGLGYQKLRALNPKLIWMALSSAGQFGDMAGIRAYAPTMAAIAGLEATIGYEGEEPIGTSGFAFGDMNGGSHAITVALAALLHARKTGQGQYVDFALIEATMATLCEPMAELALAGKDPAIRGMRHTRMAPHGNFRCQGKDQWMAVSAPTEAGWRALVEVVSPDKLARMSELDSVEGRRRNLAQINDAIEAWTSARPRDQAVAELRNKGAAATPVLTFNDLARDWPEDQSCYVQHTVTGTERVLAAPWHMSLTKPKATRAAPMLGEHTRYVLETIMGLPPAKVDELLASPATR